MIGERFEELYDKEFKKAEMIEKELLKHDFSVEDHEGRLSQLKMILNNYKNIKNYIYLNGENDKVALASSLDNVSIVYGRAVGNTTRIVDNAIQLIFTGYKTYIVDHHEKGSRLLFDRIIGRLKNEFNLPYLLSKKIIHINEKDMVIEIIDKEYIKLK